MAEFRDSAIKLFGKTIPLRRREDVEPSSVAVSVVESGAGESCSDRKVVALADENSGEEDKEAELLNSEKGAESVRVTGDSKAPAGAGGDNAESPSKSAEQSGVSDTQDKTLKKPDKIIPCPRCSSMDTKFCYYNNYNVNQPRHFCKNCQRYWTAGGTMRNVPVGAGRRKNKNSSASHYRHLVISDALQRAQTNAGTGTVLAFGSDSPVCGSMASALNIVEKARGPETRDNNGDNHSSCSSVTASNSSERGGKTVAVDYQGFPQAPCYPGPPWPYSWNSGQWGSAALPSPGFCHSGFPVSFYPAPPYWGSNVPGSWNVPCFSPTLSTNQSALGKHSRDGEILNSSSSHKGSKHPVKENSASSDGSVLIPKTLRIDDPTEAAKSSIWATLGIKNDKLSSSGGGGMHKAFQPKGDGKSNHVLETSPVLQANPAALSRSLRFLEST